MKVPKEIRTFCPRCKKHTAHTVSLYKQGKARASALGARRHAEDKKGYGGQKFPEQKKTAKTTKKLTLMMKCKECKYILQKYGMRVRKMELVAR